MIGSSLVHRSTEKVETPEFLAGAPPGSVGQATEEHEWNGGD
jgi:hypothetical protein